MTATDTWGTTPGPWTIEEYGDYEPALVIRNSKTHVCFMDIPGPLSDPAKIARDANAIAELPAMIAFIEDFICDADAGQLVGQAREAEARAIKRRVTGQR